MNEGSAYHRIPVSCNLADAEQAAICGGDEHFVRGVEIGQGQCFLAHRNARPRSNFQQHAARHAFEASRRKRRREYLAVLHTKDIRGSAFGGFAALVQQKHFGPARFEQAEEWEPSDRPPERLDDHGRAHDVHDDHQRGEPQEPEDEP